MGSFNGVRVPSLDLGLGFVGSFKGVRVPSRDLGFRVGGLGFSFP